MNMEAESNAPKPLKDFLGYAKAAIELAKDRYPVTISRETLDGKVLKEPRKFENESELSAFCEEAEKEEKAHYLKLQKDFIKVSREGVSEEPSPQSAEGYWRIRSTK